MRKNIYCLLIVTICSVLIVSCGNSGGDGEVANTAPVNTDCVLGTSNIEDCTL